MMTVVCFVTASGSRTDMQAIAWFVVASGSRGRHDDGGAFLITYCFVSIHKKQFFASTCS